jgi:outer membrane murein-binding lipoprotein Lpp
MTMYPERPNVSVEFLERQLAQLKGEAGESKMAAPQTGGPGSGSNSGPEVDRVGKLEGAVDGLRHNQSMLLGAVGLVLTVLVGVSVYGLNRLDQINTRVTELPSKISSDFRDITKTLAEVITAAKQQQPQVILMPAPQQPEPKEPTKP